MEIVAGVEELGGRKGNNRRPTVPMQIHVWDTSGVGICVSKYIEISS